MNETLWSRLIKTTTTKTTINSVTQRQIFLIFRYRLLLLASILLIIFILLYLCAQYYNYAKSRKFSKKFVYYVKFKLINLIFSFKKTRKTHANNGLRLNNLSKQYSYINKSFLRSMENDLSNNNDLNNNEDDIEAAQTASKLTQNSIYSSSATLLTIASNFTTLPLIMITDTTSLQTDIIDLENYNEEKTRRSSLENRLRHEINEKMPRPYK